MLDVRSVGPGVGDGDIRGARCKVSSGCWGAEVALFWVNGLAWAVPDVAKKRPHAMTARIRKTGRNRLSKGLFAPRM